MDTQILKQIIIENRRLLFERDGIVERDLSEGYDVIIKSKPIIVITGVRRCGKSTLMSIIAGQLIKRDVEKENIFYINFESEHFVDFKADDYQKILEAYYELHPSVKGRIYLFLDEIQNVPYWEKWLTRLYEDKKYKIFVTGSNASMLSSEIATALVGRCYRIELFPFNFREYLRFRKVSLRDEREIHITEVRSKVKSEFNSYLLAGGFPEIIAERHLHLMHELYQNIVYRDIIVRHGIKNVKAFRDLAYYLLSNAASLTSYNALKKVYPSLKSVNTVRNYIQYLEDAYLLFTVQIFSASLKVQMRNPMKIYSIDTGLLNEVSFRISANLSKLYENLVFLNLRRAGKEIYYYKGRGEVDFICMDREKVEDIIQVSFDVSDVKTKEREERAMLEALTAFRKKHGIIITSGYEKRVKINSGVIEYIPLYKWLLGVG
ncbi:MAG: ATP-binding protein [Nitrospirota bacterium]